MFKAGILYHSLNQLLGIFNGCGASQTNGRKNAIVDIVGFLQVNTSFIDKLIDDCDSKNRGWSATQVLLKFVILQLLITVAVLGVFFKIR